MQTRFPRATRVPSKSSSGAAALAASCALALLFTGLLAAAQPAAAQQGFGNFFTYQQQKPRKRLARKQREQPQQPAAEQAQAAPQQQVAAAKAAAKSETKPASKAEAKPAEKSGPQGTVYAIVSLPDQHVTVYDANGVIARSRVSTGQAGHRTPVGVFSVIGKSRYHHSNIYSGAPMPWMQRITWSGVAMHAGVVPGYPASHGCIRLPYSFAPQLFALTKVGARVVVASRDTAPVEFSHPFLPLPKMQPPPSAQQQASASSPSVELASMETSTSAMTTAAVGDPTSSKPLNPIAYAGALKERAKTDKTAADRAAAEALNAAQTAGTEARQAVDDVRKAETDLKAAEAKVAEIDARAAAPAPAAPAANAPTAGTGDPAAALQAEKAAAQEAVTRARTALDEARAREGGKTSAAFAAVDAWKRTVATADAAGKLVDEAGRRQEQVSVFISRKEGRIFIRQDWKEVWEAPVTFRDPDRPLGTHIYTAVDTAADGSAVKWTAITIPAESVPAKSEGKEPAVAAAPETAAGALDRIELPEGARERIAELLWTGGSLIVSDNARSGEMSEYSDFIIMTR